MRKTLVLAVAALFVFLAGAAPARAALTLAKDWESKFGSEKVVAYTVTFDLSYPTGGETLNTSNTGFTAIRKVLCEQQSGYRYEYDYTNSKLKVFGLGPKTIFVDDSDTPSSSATALYVSMLDGAHGMLKSANTGGSASSYFTLTDASTKVNVVLDATTTTDSLYHKVYFNDTAAAGSRLLISNSVFGTDIYVPTVAGNYLKLTHSATADSSPQTYFDDDGAVASQRILVSTSQSADSSESLSTTFGIGFGEVANAADLSSLSMRVFVIGR